MALNPCQSVGKASAFVQHHGSSVNKERQEGPHAHYIQVSEDNRYAFAVDLGLDEVLTYRFDGRTGALTPNDPPFAKIKAGSGPRHLAFSADRKLVYVVNELGSTRSAIMDLLEPVAVQRIVRGFAAGQARDAQVWSLLVLERWARRFLAQPQPATAAPSEVVA